MRQSPVRAVVFSQRSLVRELLGDLLLVRCGVHVMARCARLEDCEAALTTANLLVCDVAGLRADTLEGLLARLRTARPQIPIVTIDDSRGDFDVAEIVSAVHEVSSHEMAPHEQLTPLEIEVLLSVASGLRNAEIARHMSRSSKTVEKHRASLLRKLGLQNVAQLTAYAIRHHLLDPDAILARRRA